MFNIICKCLFSATCFMIAAACCASLYWASSANSILGLCSVFVAMSSIGGACVVNIIVDNFPTGLRYNYLIRQQLQNLLYAMIHRLFHAFLFRTMAVSLTMMVGRLGAVIGNLLFPILFNLSCLGPFCMIGSASLGKNINKCGMEIRKGLTREVM